MHWIADFEEKGWLYFPGALAKNTVLPIKNHVQNELKRLAIWSNGRTLSQKLKGVPVFQQTTKLGQWISYPNLNERLVTPELYSTMCQLAGSALSAQEAQLLISLPHSLVWSLEGLNWHRDVSGARLNKSAGVQAFVLLDEVSARGGATLGLSGSHRLTTTAETARVLSELKTGKVDRESILEMTGRAGDVYLMDMRLLHTPSINAGKGLRIMATSRYFVS